MSLPSVTSQLILRTYYILNQNNGLKLFKIAICLIHRNPPWSLHQHLLYEKEKKEEHDRNCLIRKREVIGYIRSHTQVHTFLAALMA